MRIAVLGAGTLAAFIIDIASRGARFEVAGQYDDRYPELTHCNGAPVLGRLDDVPAGTALAIGVGEPRLRKELFERFTALDCTFPALIDPSCVVCASARVAPGVILGPLSTVLAGSEILEAVCVLGHVSINQDVRVGAFALIGAGALIGNGARIGDGAHIGLGARVPRLGVVEDWGDVS